MPPEIPAQVWIGAMLFTNSGLSTLVTALPTIRRRISPTPIGRTPEGFLARGISLPARFFSAVVDKFGINILKNHYLTQLSR